MRNKIDARSIRQGFSTSRLPKFTDREKKYIKGTADFLGVNCYTSSLVKPSLSDTFARGLNEDSEVDQYQPADWEATSVSWLKVRLNVYVRNGI